MQDPQVIHIGVFVTLGIAELALMGFWEGSGENGSTHNRH